MDKKPRPRRARPLLLAGAGVATLLAGCVSNQPMGNLKAPDCDMNPAFCDSPADLREPVDLVDADAPFGNLKPNDVDLPLSPPDGGVDDGGHQGDGGDGGDGG